MWSWLESIVAPGNWRCQFDARRAKRPRAARTFEPLECRTLLSAGGGWLGAGITGQYFNNTTLSGSPDFSRSDVRLDFPQGTITSPAGFQYYTPSGASIGETNWSAKWNGSIVAKYSETYTLKADVSDSFKLQIAAAGTSNWTNVPYVFNTGSTGGAWATATFTFTAGTTYAVNMTFTHAAGAWGLQLHWLSSGPNAFAEEAIEPATPVGINVDDDPQLFANATVLEADKLGGAVDAQGNPTTASSSLFFQYAPGGESGGNYLVTFSGEAALSGETFFDPVTNEIYNSNVAPTAADAAALGWSNVDTSMYNAATNTTTIGVQSGSGGLYYLNFSLAQRSSGGSPGYTNLQVMEPTSPGATTWFQPGTEFAPAALSFASNFTVFRFADFTGYTSSDVNWSQAPVPGGPGYASQASNDGAPWQYAINFANATGKDMYLNIPVLASDAYVTSLANAIKYGSDASGTPYTSPTANPVWAPLNPNLNVYFELADELWNWGYVTTNHDSEGLLFSAMWDYNHPTANNTPPPGSNDSTTILMSDGTPVAPYGSEAILGSFYTQNINYDLYAMGQFLTDTGFSITSTANGSDSWTAPDGTVWYYKGNPAGIGWNSVGAAARIIQLSNDFRSVYAAAMPGNGTIDCRIRPLLEWQDGWPAGSEGAVLQWLWSYYSNSTYVTPEPLNYYLWGGGGAFYSGLNNYIGDGTSDASAANVNTCFNSGLALAGIGEDVTYARAYGLQDVAYEGGFNAGGWGDTPLSVAIESDPRAAADETASLTSFYQDGGAIPIIYNMSGRGDWSIDNPSIYAPVSQRTLAVEAFEQSLPPAVSYGMALGQTDNPNYQMPQGNRQDSGLYGDGLWLVTTPGTYQASFSCSNVAQIELLLNGQPIGTETGTNFSIPVEIATPGNEALSAVNLSCASGNAGRPYFTLSTSQLADVDLAGAYNREGIVSNGTTFSGSNGFDGAGNALSANALGLTSSTPAETLSWNGNPYTVESYNTDNMVSCAGQTITLPQASFSALSFLAAAAGNQTSQIFTVTYTDGSTQQFIQSFSGWTTPENYSGESVAAAMTYRDTSTGGTTSGTTDIYGYSFSLNPAKDVASITLPVDVNLNLIAADLVPSNANLAGACNREGIVSDGYVSVAPTSLPSDGAFTSTGGCPGGGYVQQPTGTPWGFTNAAGIMADNDSSFPMPSTTSGYAAYLNNNGSQAELAQPLGLLPAGTYALSYESAACGSDANPIQLSVDTVDVGGQQAPASGTAWTTYTLYFTNPTPAAPCFIGFTGCGGTSGGNNLSFIYNVTLTQVSPGSGGLDGAGNALPANLMPQTVTSGSVPFAVGAANANNVVSCTGQTIPLPAGNFSTLSLLATAAGNQTNQTFTVAYSGGVIPDASFATSSVTAGNWAYGPSGTPWTFSGGSGIEGNASWGAPSDPDGDGFAAFLQESGSIAQSLNFAAAGTYQISFQAAQRPGYPLDPIQFSLDGNAAGTINPASSSAWTGYTVQFTVPTAGAHTISFAGTNTGTDCASFIDELSLQQTQQFTQSFSSWTAPQAYTGESTVLSTAHFDHDDGTVQSSTRYVYGYSFTLNSANVVQSITLPSNGNIEILAMGSIPATRANYRPSYRPLSRPPLTLSASPPASGYPTADGPLSAGGAAPAASPMIAAAAASVPAVAVSAAGALSSSLLLSTATATLAPPVLQSAPPAAAPVGVAAVGASRSKSVAAQLRATKPGPATALLSAVAWQSACDACFAADGWLKP